MSLLGKSLGLFSIEKSDIYVGSYISKEDVETILFVDSDDLANVKFKNINGGVYIDETTLRKKYWEKGLIPNAVPFKKGTSTISLDEYILISIIKTAYPNANVVSQYKWGRKHIDIYVELGNKKFFIEFHGPGHFKKMSVYKDPENPFERKNAIEKEFGIPCYIWPYWIQRCERNLKILIGDPSVKGMSGLAALWSTKVFFGEFCFEDSAQIIDTITQQFNAADHGYGYMYEQWNDPDGPLKEQHPILKSIIMGKKDVELLIPKGTTPANRSKWLPQVLINKAILKN